MPFVISPTGTGDAEDDSIILPGSASLLASPTCLPFIESRSLLSVPGRAARHGSCAGWAWVCTAATVARNLRKRHCSFARRSLTRSVAGIASNMPHSSAIVIWRRGYGNLPARELPLTRASRFSILKEMPQRPWNCVGDLAVLTDGEAANAQARVAVRRGEHAPGTVCVRRVRTEIMKRIRNFIGGLARISQSAIETDFVANCLKNQEVLLAVAEEVLKQQTMQSVALARLEAEMDRLKADLKRLEETMSQKTAQDPQS